jgi:hypothetical protein
MERSNQTEIRSGSILSYKYKAESFCSQNLKVLPFSHNPEPNTKSQSCSTTIGTTS